MQELRCHTHQTTKGKHRKAKVPKGQRGTPAPGLSVRHERPTPHNEEPIQDASNHRDERIVDHYIAHQNWIIFELPSDEEFQCLRRGQISEKALVGGDPSGMTSNCEWRSSNLLGVERPSHRIDTRNFLILYASGILLYAPSEGLSLIAHTKRSFAGMNPLRRCFATGVSALLEWFLTTQSLKKQKIIWCLFCISGVVNDPPPPWIAKKHLLVQSRVKRTAFSDQN